MVMIACALDQRKQRTSLHNLCVLCNKSYVTMLLCYGQDDVLFWDCKLVWGPAVPGRAMPDGFVSLIKTLFWIYHRVARLANKLFVMRWEFKFFHYFGAKICPIGYHYLLRSRTPSKNCSHYRN